VTSALVVLDVRPQPAVRLPDLEPFFRFVEAVFQFRRKQLRSSLARATGRTPQEVERLLGELGIEPTRRAETLGLPEWERVFRVLAS
jgi:16S rRNA (adenine1518-N6/adenine1519-N6)-dimethyltransferase